MDHNEPKTERDLQELEAQLRSLGTPYQHPEPDERYWANFRVRVMDRIDAKEVPAKRSVYTVVAAWFTTSRSFAISAAVVILAALSYFLTQSSPKQPVVATTTPTEQAPAVSTPPTTAQVPVVKNTPPVQLVAPSVAVKTTKQPKQQVAPQSHEASSNDLASLDRSLNSISVLDESSSISNAEDPVDYTSLSEAELETVLSAITTMNVERN